ncbi:MAG: ribonuclease HI [Verrucomicrobia bacterium]|nr:ribonuclease HI [Verrucomicrobiota bacterium]
MEWTEIPEVNLYSDGGAEPNPGNGGFGVIMSYKGIKREFSQGYELTTNNRMELMGVIFGLERLKTKSVVNVFTDSRYVIDGIEKGWAERWKSKNWYRTRTEKAINYDLWDKLLTLISTHQKVTFNWVKGHAGHLENERCDELALAALRSDTLLVDNGYQPTQSQSDELNEGDNIQSNFRKTKVSAEGDACRKCGTSVLKKPTKKKAAKPRQTYYYEYFLLCPSCKTMYLLEEAKRDITNQDSNLFS